MKYDINDDTLYSLVTEAFPIVLFTKKLEDNSRKVMEITECEILPNGKRQIHTLFRYHVRESKIIEGKLNIIGNYEKINDLSKNIQKRLLENGMPLSILESLLSPNLTKEGDI